MNGKEVMVRPASGVKQGRRRTRRSRGADRRTRERIEVRSTASAVY